MSDFGSKSTFDYAGGYNLGTMALHNADGDRIKLEMGIVTELNIHEDIDAHAVTGNVHIFDSNILYMYKHILIFLLFSINANVPPPLELPPAFHLFFLNKIFFF